MKGSDNEIMMHCIRLAENTFGDGEVNALDTMEIARLVYLFMLRARNAGFLHLSEDEFIKIGRKTVSGE